MIKKTLLKTTSLVTLAMTISAFSPSLANAAWKQNSLGWWYTEGNSWATGWRQINGTWYFFDANGYMKTGWVKDNGSWYYMDNSGAMKTGWVKDGSTWYYMDKSGAMKTGWVKYGYDWYYMNNSGAMQTGWVYYNSAWYYMNDSGAMRTGWINDGNNDYFLSEDGSMMANAWVSNGHHHCFVGSSGTKITGFHKFPDGHTYYFYEDDGFMAINTIVDDYFIDENGYVSDKKVDVTYSEEDANDLINKEDSIFIKDFADRQGLSKPAIEFGCISKLSSILTDYQGVEDELVYFFVSYDPSDSETLEAYVYFVGITSGKVYRTTANYGNDVFEMKDNTVVNTYKYDILAVAPNNA